MDDRAKAELHDYLRGAREVLAWKLEGLDEYDVRRPLTPSGTSLLGLVAHNTATHRSYLVDVFGRSPDDGAAAPATGGEPGGEFWVNPDDTRRDVLDRYQETCELADRTMAALPLDATGHVWWWGDEPVTLHHVVVHVVAETQRHAGHADILRELLDGAVGLLPAAPGLRLPDETARRSYHDRVAEAAARFR